MPNVGGTGLSAAIVAQAGQTIANRPVHAAPCDIGIYVGAGASGVRITSVKVSGAGYDGIFVEKTSNVAVVNSTVTGNGFKTIFAGAPTQPGNGLSSYVNQSFGISLFGVSNSVVSNNRVYGNGRGGIGLMDNGPINPGASSEHGNKDVEAALIPSTNDRITRNQTRGNYNGCGIVIATQNFGGAEPNISNIVVSRNTITGTGDSKTNGWDTGGLVVAANLPGSQVANVLVSGNQVTGSAEAGLIVNAEAPGSSTNNVTVVDNFASNNNRAGESPTTAQYQPQTGPPLPGGSTAGVVIYTGAPGAVNNNTVVAGNTLTNQFYGIWSFNTPLPTVFGNLISVTQGGTPVSLNPVP